MIYIDTISQGEIDALVEEHEWEQDPDEPELEEFTGFCPECGAEMECIEVAYKDGCEVGNYVCMHCDKETAQRSRVWVYEDGPYADHICEDM